MRQDTTHSPGGDPRAAQDGSPGRCPICRAKIVVSDGGQVLIKNAILRVDRPSGRVTAKCAQCKSWVDVPLTYVG